MHIPKVFIFDMDGTVFDTEQISYICWRDVCREYGYELPEDLFRSVIGMDNRRIAAVFGRYFGPEFPYDPIREKKVADQLQYYREHIIQLNRDCGIYWPMRKGEAAAAPLRRRRRNHRFAFCWKRPASLRIFPSSRAAKT